MAAAVTTAAAAAPAAAPAACPPAPPYPAPPAPRPHYDLRLSVDAARGDVAGVETVRFAAPGTDRLVFRLWPNGTYTRRIGARLRVTSASAGGKPLRVRVLDPTTLVVPRRPEVTLRFRLHVPVVRAALSRLGHGQDEIRLASFFPLLPWDPRRGWVVDPPSSGPAETWTSPVADFDVRVRARAGETAVATGREIAPGVFRARAVRDFALAVGRFSVAHATAHAPHAVRVTAAVEAGSASPAAALYAARAVRALDRLSRLYGPYPWPTFSVAVTTDVGGSGIEYPNMVFLGPNSLERATTHEVAHQWFYSLVGDDQWRDSWLDEGLTSWAQSRVDDVFPFFDSLAIPADASGHMGATMGYWDRHPQSWFAGVYAQTVQELARLGPRAQVDCALRHYVAENAYRTAQPSDLLAVLRRFFPAGAVARFERALGR